MCIYEKSWSDYITYTRRVRTQCFDGEEIIKDFNKCCQEIFNENFKKDSEI